MKPFLAAGLAFGFSASVLDRPSRPCTVPTVVCSVLNPSHPQLGRLGGKAARPLICRLRFGEFKPKGLVPFCSLSE